MAIETWADHFKGPQEIAAEIEARGLYLLDLDLSGFPRDEVPHAHDYDQHIYVLEGVLELGDPQAARVHRVETGGKAFVPAGTPHFGIHGGYKGTIALSDDPAKYKPAPGLEKAFA